MGGGGARTPAPTGWLPAEDRVQVLGVSLLPRSLGGSIPGPRLVSHAAATPSPQAPPHPPSCSAREVSCGGSTGTRLLCLRSLGPGVPLKTPAAGPRPQTRVTRGTRHVSSVRTPRSPPHGRCAPFWGAAETGCAGPLTSPSARGLQEAGADGLWWPQGLGCCPQGSRWWPEAMVSDKDSHAVL